MLQLGRISRARPPLIVQFLARPGLVLTLGLSELLQIACLTIHCESQSLDMDLWNKLDLRFMIPRKNIIWNSIPPHGQRDVASNNKSSGTVTEPKLKPGPARDAGSFRSNTETTYSRSAKYMYYAENHTKLLLLLVCVRSLSFAQEGRRWTMRRDTATYDSTCMWP